MEIKIGKSARQCRACEESFVHEQPMHSLVRIEDQQFVREDYCEACWKPERAERSYSAWTPRYYDPAVAEQQPPEVFSPLRRLFYDAVESGDRATLAMAYLAAQLLRRQKVFRLIKETDSSDEEASIMLFADRLGDRFIEVRDPALSHAEMDEGRQRLIARLNELENPGQESSTEETDHAESPQEQPAKR